MNEELIADIWTLVLEHIPEKYRKDVAADFVNALLDHDVKEVVLKELKGVDAYLDVAIDYVIDSDTDSEVDYDEE